MPSIDTPAFGHVVMAAGASTVVWTAVVAEQTNTKGNTEYSMIVAIVDCRQRISVHTNKQRTRRANTIAELCRSRCEYHGMSWV